MSKGVTFPSENQQGSCPGVLVGDPAKTKRGIIVLQEWWGMNQQIQDEAADIASRGPFVAIVPDLYRGKMATDHEEAGHLMNDLDWPGAIKDIQGAAKYLLQEVGCTKVGVTGFCMGGALSLAAAVYVPEISAASPFYGIPGESIDVTKIKIPLQCHFGKNDDIVGFSSPAEQEVLRKKLDGANVKHEFHVYEAGHAFTNATSANFHESSCKAALDRLIKFMNTHLS